MVNEQNVFPNRAVHPKYGSNTQQHFSSFIFLFILFRWNIVELWDATLKANIIREPNPNCRENSAPQTLEHRGVIHISCCARNRTWKCRGSKSTMKIFGKRSQYKSHRIPGQEGRAEKRKGSFPRERKSLALRLPRKKWENAEHGRDRRGSPETTDYCYS